MKVVGISFIRDAVRLGYPIEEALRSILPICDEVVVAVGKSSDSTLDLVQSIDPSKVRVIETEWDENLRSGGAVLAVETNKALKAVGSDADWIVYIQGDEVLHEDGYPEIRNALHRYQHHERVDGLLFKYRHFYGSFDYVGISSNWYKNEIRVIKNNRGIYSYKDAQGFRKGKDEKLNVIPLKAYIHHYGWVREPEKMQLKRISFGKLYHSDDWIEKKIGNAEKFDYGEVEKLIRFEGVHPKVIQERINKKNWEYDRDLSFQNLSFKDRFKIWAKKYLGWSLYYEGYNVINE